MSASERMQKIIALGRERLRLAREGNDFFQSAPQIEPCNNLLMWYLSQFGRVINSDCAKLAFLKEGYEPTDPNSVAEFYKRASLIVQSLVEEMLSVIDNQSIVVFMAGGNGAGKSTFCNGARAGLTENDWIIDATLASYEASANTMREVIKKGAKVALVFIDRDQESAWTNGVLKRSLHGSHQTPRSVFESTHSIVPKNVQRFISEFRDAIVCYEHIRNFD